MYINQNVNMSINNRREYLLTVSSYHKRITLLRTLLTHTCIERVRTGGCQMQEEQAICSRAKIRDLPNK